MNTRGRANVTFAETENRERGEGKNRQVPRFCAAADIRTKPAGPASVGPSSRQKKTRAKSGLVILVARDRIELSTHGFSVQESNSYAIF